MSGKQGTTPRSSTEGGRPGLAEASALSKPTSVVLFLAVFASLLLLAACGLTETDWAAPSAMHTTELPQTADRPPADTGADNRDDGVIESASEQPGSELVLNEHVTQAVQEPHIVVNNVTSTVAGTARIAGAVNPAIDVDATVTANGTVSTVHLRPGVDGIFEFDIPGLVSGPQTVCLNELCHRVFVSEETHESFDVIHRRILDALVQANQVFDFETALPDWTVMVAGPSTGAGGHFDPINRVISISGTSGRTTEEFVTTILHEVGHAMEFEYLSEEDRAAYRSMRGIHADTTWMPGDLLAHERWESPAEDFAEVFVAWLTNGEHQTRSTMAEQPTVDQIQAFSFLIHDWS